MAGSSWGTLLTMTTWGESHGKGVGVVIDGCPSGLELKEADIQKFLDRRKPGQSRYSTKRQEGDEVEILSGVFEGRTTGTPISLLIRNLDQRSKDYSQIKDIYRPGHADYTFDEKYGFRDYRGGGRSSGRETVGRVAAGAVAVRLLESLGIQVTAYAKSIGPIEIEESRFDRKEISRNSMCMPDAAAAFQAEDYIRQMMEQKDSVGGVVECVVTGMPAGVGEPVFEKLDARLAHAVMSIGAVKGVEIGDGFASAKSRGTENNDAFRMKVSEKKPVKTTNHAGGILGGISDGSTIVLRAGFKPTPSISSPQQTVNRQGENVKIIIGGRHDPIIVPRAVVVVETVTAFTIADMLLQSMTSRIDKIQKFFSEE
ncbi:MAG: chorismate synthase [Hungatella sp.]|nr:chorismate synthase [Hungatella sp.]